MLRASRRFIVAPALLVGLRHFTNVSCDEEEAHFASAKSRLIVSDFKSFLKEDQVVTNVEERKTRAKAWNTYHTTKNIPSVIVYPESTEDVSKIVKACRRADVPIVAFGGGTSLEGHTLTTSPDSVCLDFGSMKRILEFNKTDLDMRVQAGIGYIELNEILKPSELWFPLDPGPGASIGGMCACRCSGSTAVRYGSMRENVLNVTAVLSDGTIVKTGSRARKSSAGYDITRLLIGSEGTLGIITEVALKLHGIPKHSHALRVCFDNIVDAAATARDTLNCGVTIGRCEMLDDEMMAVVNRANPTMDPKWPEKFTLMYEVVGPSADAVNEQLSIVRKIAKQHNGKDFMTATNKEQCKYMWDVRKACIWSTLSEYPDRESMITDACVPLSRLPDIMEETRRAIDKTKLPCPIVAHAGDGNYHVIIMFKPDDPKEVALAKELANGMARRAIEMGGTCTGEHGVGVGKIDLLYSEMGEGTMSVMETIKAAMDPARILNPGKLLKEGDRKLSVGHGHFVNSARPASVCMDGGSCAIPSRKGGENK